MTWAGPLHFQTFWHSCRWAHRLPAGLDQGPGTLRPDPSRRSPAGPEEVARLLGWLCPEAGRRSAATAPRHSLWGRESGCISPEHSKKKKKKKSANSYYEKLHPWTMYQEVNSSLLQNIQGEAVNVKTHQSTRRTDLVAVGSSTGAGKQQRESRALQLFADLPQEMSEGATWAQFQQSSVRTGFIWKKKTKKTQ